jgi:L,D-transpeptidase ErfK/SrfK
MLKKFFIFLIILLGTVQLSYARSSSYGAGLCESSPNVHCITVQRGQSWVSLWPDSADRDKVQRLNRMNTSLSPGMHIAVPNNITSVSLMQLSPFGSTIKSDGRKTIFVSLSELAWGAYNSEGKLVNWGPVSGGKSYCPDLKQDCGTALGTYTIYERKGAGCVSSKFPIGKGGAPMPYCMFFTGGYAIHGSNTVPGYNASHGCVRVFTSDARWLNEQFVDMPGTRVIVKH